MQNSEWLNYHHLFYFWRVAREKSLSRAADQLRLSHSTLSTQIRALETFLGGELFLRSGRALSLTALGKDVLQYADEIFRVGSELVEMATTRSSPRRATLEVGVVDAIPKTVVYRFVEPALQLPDHGAICLRQDKLERLLEDMSAGKLHLILSDQPPPQGLTMHVYCRMIGETGIKVYGPEELSKQYRTGFPHSLNGAPMLLPGKDSSLRVQLDRWFAEHDIHVEVAGEFDDSMALGMFGILCSACFPVRAALAPEIEGVRGAMLIGELDGVRERFYAVSTERRIWRNEARLLLEQARHRLLDPIRL